MIPVFTHRIAVRIAAVVLVGVFVGVAVLTALSYSAAFTPTATVIVTSPRAGLLMEPDAKVKYLGLQVGTVTAVE